MFKFWYDATMLSFEAQRVVGLRMMKLAGGGPSCPGRGEPDGDGENRRVDERSPRRY